MLRLVYLSLLYWRCGGNVWALFRGKKEQPEASSDSTVSGDAVENGNSGVAPASQVPPVLSPSGSTRGGYDAPRDPALVDSLKRRIIRDKITPLMMLTSVVADLDLFADWLFLKEGLEGQSQLLSNFALAFTVVGTFMYVLVTLEFHPISKVWTCLRGRPLSPEQHVSLGWQLLLNVVVEDVPQLIITGIADPTSGAGVLNIATAGFSLLAKAAEAFATLRDPPMSAQARKIEEDPGIIRYINRKKLEIDRMAATIAGLIGEYRDAVIRGADSQRPAAIAFKIMQADGGFMDGELGYVRGTLEIAELDLSECRLEGSIPSELGSLSRLMVLILQRNQLEGTIPTEVGNLSALTKLVLDHNKLSGTIPRQLGELRELQVLSLGGNQLDGTIPMELGTLSKLEELHLRKNKLSGAIPPELGGLTALQALLLGGNQLTAVIPPELGGLAALERLFLHDNKLTGTIPPELGGLPALRILWLNDNQLTGAIPPELGGLAALQQLYLHQNKLTGSIPEELGQLKGLERAYFSGNNFSGTKEEVKRMLPKGCDIYW
eukprot:g12973.t1